ncbi:two-component sensor histidine kinase [Helicobacter sp. 12S02634-8]|uniref:sensor histidine kinase n=1 Tax=Helicobacter sp. 12S02634-8 TaxID=1476199 RepID=UPI000BD22224|nr:ATP-binding protein [Helicobacter sp. 12S02634-8]PAF47164.1 two-component sensor histidine kinase [Helicobacter sp. 12S02634-8]
MGESLLQKLEPKDKQELLERLNEFILQTYKIEKEFKDYKALYEWVIEILPQAIWVINGNGSFFYKNTLAEGLKPLFSEAKKLDFDGEVKAEGRTYLFQNNSIQNKQIITATDITAQKRQERLASMGQVSAHLAHEIRNPIGSISLLASTLLKRVDSTSKPIVFEIQKALWRVERIIAATLLFSKDIQIHKKPYALNALCEELEEAIERYTYSKVIDFKFDFSAQEAWFDWDLMGIVLQNFIYNAIDAIEDSEVSQGQIVIKAFVMGDKIVFSISDNGKAIENKALLFEPFETTKLKGNGLGLALSLQIVQAHNGSIELLDTAEKTFKIELANT